MKHCRKCKQNLPKEDFYKNSNAKDGLTTYCKKCHKECLTPYKKKESRQVLANFKDGSVQPYKSLNALCSDLNLNYRYAKWNLDNCSDIEPKRGILITKV